MATRLTALHVEAADPLAQARFWAALLEWDVDEAVVSPPASDGGELSLVFVPERERKRVKNRVHLDLASTSSEHQSARVSQAISLGAQRIDIGQGAVPWVVLADPEGNEFCVLEPRPGYTMTESLAAIVVDAADPAALARTWAPLTSWRVASRQEVIVGLRAPTGRGPWLECLQVPAEAGRARPSRLRPAVSGAGRRPSVERDSEGNEYVLLAQA